MQKLTNRVAVHTTFNLDLDLGWSPQRKRNSTLERNSGFSRRKMLLNALISEILAAT